MNHACILSMERPLRIRVADAQGDTWSIILDDAGTRGLVVLVAPNWAASNFWPQPDRGPSDERRSLLRFLLNCDVSYLARKLGVERWFDAEATQANVERWLTDNVGPDTVALDEWITEPMFGDHEDLRVWLANAAEAGLDIHDSDLDPVFALQPDFVRFYETAWPLLRASQTEIEAVLYPAGLP